MNVVAAQVERLAWTISGGGAARGVTRRDGVVIELRGERGVCARGEASPLPRMSPDTLAEAEAACRAFAPGPRGDWRAPEVVSPAARFAIESALLGLLAAERGVGAADVLAGEVGRVAARGVPVAHVVDTVAEARALAARGVRTLKLKVTDSDAAIAWVREIAAAVPGVQLRLDANRGWSAGRGDALADLGAQLAFVEEPGAACGLPVALDESLAAMTDAEVAAAVARGGVAALVLKPTLLGLDRAWRLAQLCTPAVISHTLEGPVGRAACAELALAVGAGCAHGLGDDRGLAELAR